MLIPPEISRVHAKQISDSTQVNLFWSINQESINAIIAYNVTIFYSNVKAGLFWKIDKKY